MKKKAKKIQKRYISKDMGINRSDDISSKKGKKRVRKPKMPARIKSTPRGKQK
jgi:hypothetical protein